MQSDASRNGLARWIMAMAALLALDAARAGDAGLRPPSQCTQLGGKLACKPALPTAWIYRAEGKSFDDEASAYAHMLSIHDSASVLSLTYRWGQAPAGYWQSQFVRTIETSSWKIYRRCIADDNALKCDEFPGLVGYHRVRRVSCPDGYGFSSEPASPLCLPTSAMPIQTVGAGSQTATR